MTDMKKADKSPPIDFGCLNESISIAFVKIDRLQADVLSLNERLASLEKAGRVLK